MVKLFEIAELRIAEEVTKGTEVTPTEARIRVYNPSYTAEIGKFDRTPLANSFSKLGTVATQSTARLTFSVEVRRTNAGATPDIWGSLLEACGMKETIGASVVYTPTSDLATQKTMTIWLVRDGIIQKMKGAMGNVTFRGQIGEVMMADFEFMGVYVTPASGTMTANIVHETASPEAFQGISFVYDAGAGTPFSGAVFGSLNLSLGNRVVMRQDANSAAGNLSALITGRDPKLTIDPEVTTLSNGASARNFWADMEADTKLEMTFNMNASIAVTIPAAIVREVSDSERDGIWAVSVNMDLAKSDEDGDDELSIDMS